MSRQLIETVYLVRDDQGNLDLASSEEDYVLVVSVSSRSVNGEVEYFFHLEYLEDGIQWTAGNELDCHVPEEFLNLLPTLTRLIRDVIDQDKIARGESVVEEYVYTFDDEFASSNQSSMPSASEAVTGPCTSTSQYCDDGIPIDEEFLLDDDKSTLSDEERHQQMRQSAVTHLRKWVLLTIMGPPFILAPFAWEFFERAQHLAGEYKAIVIAACWCSIFGFCVLGIWKDFVLTRSQVRFEVFEHAVKKWCSPLRILIR